jgi:hypothetical protein
MGITPGGIHEKSTLIGTNSLGKCLWALLNKDVSPTLGAWLRSIELAAILIMKFWNDDLALELWLTNLALDARTVDGNITKICKQLLSTVLGANQVEELWSIIDESCPAVSINEGWVRKERCEERNVGLDTTDAELNQSSQHLAPGDFVGGTVASALDQHGVVIWGNDSASETIATIETDTVTTSRAVDLNLASIWAELLCRILSGDTALNGETASGDAILGETKLWQGGASSNLDLGGNDINAGDLLSDSVLDLNTWVNLNEVVAVLLVNQELSGTSVAVVDRLGELHRIVQDGLTNIRWKILGWRKLNNLLMSALHGAVALVQMHNVAMVITQQLNLNVLWLVEEALDEDRTVAESGLGLGCGTLKMLLQRVLVAHNTHTTTTATIRGLDDDWEAVLVGE